MGYIKAIISGSNLELYEYEKKLGAVGGKRGRRKVSSPVDMWGVPLSEHDIELQKISKRQDTKNRTLSAFRRLIVSNNFRSAPPLLITLTYKDNMCDLREAYADFNRFIIYMRRSYGQEFRYIAVPEFQKRGAVHFHALFWGLPEDLARKERDTREVASKWGLGFVDVFLTDGDEKLAGYLAKYLGKAHTDPRLFGMRSYRCSRNVHRPRFEKNLAGLYYLNEVYCLNENEPILDKFFETKWLGKARYRLYKNVELSPNYIIS